MGNLIMQLFLGIPLELVHKGFEVGMVYMAGVLAGGFVHFGKFNWDTVYNQSSLHRIWYVTLQCTQFDLSF